MKKLKQYFLLIGLMVVSVQINAQNKVRIFGELTGYQPQAVIYFTYTDVVKEKQIKMMDSAKIVNGKFEKSIMITEPSKMVLIMSPDGKQLNEFKKEEEKTVEAITLYVDKGEFHLKFEGSFSNWKMDPPVQIVSEYTTLMAMLNDRNTGVESVNRRYTRGVNMGGDVEVKEGEVDAYQQALERVNRSAVNNVTGFIKNHTKSYIGLVAILYCHQFQPGLGPKLSALLKDYTTELQNSTLGKKLRVELEMSR
ncbi:hypothetical protein ABIE26_001192 [Pedobacter africanus]|uniref:Uncharacterized protein n=1 Tax=Pedobacter africanus TaxID=151894 RepID=A0ACC6KSJ7_9SPHI|nr:DUF4369 domain-containing protein [Pedobacter africanus]MDR6782320.1 hypothetical protein [Pedobacter africanus]